MHCVNGAAIPIRLALLGARYGLCEPLVSPFAPRKNETFAERKATNFAKAISDDPFESAGVVGEATALLGTKIKAGNFLVKVQEIRLKQEAAARNATEARRKAMEEYRAQFASQATACAGSTHRGEAPEMDGMAGRGVVGAEMETDTATVAEESRGVDKAGRLKPGLQLRGPLRKNRGALIKGGRLKPGLQPRRPLRKNRGALTKAGRFKPGLQPRGPLRKNRGVLTKAGRLKPGLQPRGPLRKNRGALEHWLLRKELGRLGLWLKGFEVRGGRLAEALAAAEIPEMPAQGLASVVT